MSIIDGARVRWREWREQVAERKAAQVSDPPNVTVPAWLVRAAYFASWVATCSLIYFLWLYTLDIARDRAGELHITRAGTWEGELSFWWPYIIGFAIVAFGIPYVAKIAVPTFMSLHWKGNFWPKLWSLVIALAVSLVVIAGTFTVQGHTLMERDRDSAVAVEQVQNGRAAIQAQIDGINDDLRAATTNPNRTMAQAASVGMLAGSAEAAAAEWTRSYVQAAEAANAPNVELLRRATGAARAAGAAVERREQLRQQLAQAPAVASVQGEITTERTGWIAETLGWLEGVRAILLSLVMDIVALLMPWIALRLEQARNRQMGMAEGIPRHPWMLEDHSAEEAIIDTSPREAAKAVFDAGGTREEAEAAAREAAKTRPTRRKYETPDGQDITEYVEKNKKMVRMPRRGKNGKWVADVVVPAGEAEVTVNGKTFTTQGIPDDDRPARAESDTRIAMTAAGPVEMPSAAEGEKEHEPANGDSQDHNNGAEDRGIITPQETKAENGAHDQSGENSAFEIGQDAPPELSDDEIAAIDAELAVEEQQPAEEQPAQPEPQEGVEQADADADQRREPETNPSRMIAAE